MTYVVHECDIVSCICMSFLFMKGLIMEKHYLLQADEILKQLNTTENGLSSAEAEKRLRENGKNKLKEAEKNSDIHPTLRHAGCRLFRLGAVPVYAHGIRRRRAEGIVRTQPQRFHEF